MPRPIGRRPLLAAAMGAVAAAVLSGCGGSDGDDADGTLSLSTGSLPPDGPGIELRPDRPSTGRLVAMVGDSITVGSSPRLEDAASQLGIDLVIDAEVGRRITEGGNPDAGTEAVDELFGDVGDPDLWVIALGTNDVGKYDNPDEYAVQIQELLDLIPADDPIVWINVYLTAYPDESALFNRALTDTLTRRGRTSVGRWTDFALDEGILSDGVHPTDDGAARFVDVVTAQIAAWMS